MEALLDAVAIDDVDKVNSILNSLESNPEAEDSPSTDRCSMTINFSAQDLQDAFVQAAFSGSLKSLISLRTYGKDRYIECVQALRLIVSSISVLSCNMNQTNPSVASVILQLMFWSTGHDCQSSIT